MQKKCQFICAKSSTFALVKQILTKINTIMKKISFISALLLAIVMNVNAAVVYNGEPHDVGCVLLLLTILY